MLRGVGVGDGKTAMRATLKRLLLVTVIGGTCLPATIVCDVPNVDFVFGYDDDDWDDWFEEVFYIERYDCCDSWYCFDWFDCW
jgi:hypothetical protein